VDHRLGQSVVVIRSQNQEGLRCLGQQLYSTGASMALAKVPPELELRKGRIQAHVEGRGEPKALLPISQGAPPAPGEPGEVATMAPHGWTGHPKEPCLAGKAPEHCPERGQQGFVLLGLADDGARVQGRVGTQESIVELISGATRRDQFGRPAKVTFRLFQLAAARVPDREQCGELEGQGARPHPTSGGGLPIQR
jgi:hypothetical protein